MGQSCAVAILGGVTVRRFDGGDVQLVVSSTPERGSVRMHLTRLGHQAAGKSRYLLALDGQRPVGWVVVLMDLSEGVEPPLQKRFGWLRSRTST